MYSQKLWGLIFLALETWARGPGVGLGLLAPEISLPDFIHQRWVWDQPVPRLCISASPTSLDGYGLFNFIVVGLLFNSILMVLSDDYFIV